MKLNNKIWISLVALGLFATSCKKSLEEQKPQASLDAATAFTNAASVRAGLFGVYSAIQSSTYWGLEYLVFADLAADNLSHVGTFPTFAQIANKQILADNVNVVNDYNQIYDGINRANTLIAGVPGVSDASLDKDATLAEARTLRAMMYFDLLRYWGGSPTGYNKANGAGIVLKLTPTLNAGDAASQPKATEAQVWTAILADLDFAIGVGTYPNRISFRAGKDVAKALKARVQLYREQWAEAEALATEVISSARYSLVPTAQYENIWLQKNSTESIFELEFNTADQNSIAFYYYTTGTGGRNEVSSSTALRDAHEANDIRRAINYTTACTTCTPPYPAAKTRKYSRVGTGDDNVMLIRLAEMYLIRAEARARQAAGIVDASAVAGLADLNVIRRRAGLTDYVPTSKDDLLQAILRERRVELAHEGHRWFDLRRYNKIADLGVAQPFRALWPIPQREVLTSNNVVTQNDGY